MTRVHLKSLGKKVELSPDDQDLPILDRLENQGVQMAFGCRGGSCGVCRIEVHSGIEAFAEKGFVEEDTLFRCQDPENIRLACQACLRPDDPADTEIVIDPAPEVVLPDDEEPKTGT